MTKQTKSPPRSEPVVGAAKRRRTPANLGRSAGAIKRTNAEFALAMHQMELLRDDAWCVVLKCMPRELGWMVEGSRSEYDSPYPDTFIGKGKWCAEASDVSHLVKGREKQRWRNACFGMGNSPMEAVQKLCDAVNRK